ncbi:hypothetical protein HNQ59_001717 [Chitinivorax tropicus]|uniref:TcdA/TcdB toxin pore forming domain-containing protein n=1 Tax=Chitinivorax tropicus TaxID=714531 RepID=A0A840MIF3_9PROT|nr:hypothetical protein [Chitinivorax tropicus]
MENQVQNVLTQLTSEERTQMESLVADVFEGAILSRRWDAAVSKLAEASGLTGWNALSMVNSGPAGDEIAFINPGTTEVRWVPVNEPIFRQFSDFTRDKAVAISQGVKYDAKTGAVTMDEEAPPSVQNATQSTAYLIRSVMGLEHTDMSKANWAMQAATYFQLSRGIYNVAKDAVKIVSVVRAFIGDAPVTGVLSKVANVVGKLSTGLTGLFSVADVVLSGLNAAYATDPVAKAKAETQLGFAVGSLGIFAGSTAAGFFGAAAASSFLDSIAVPLGGIAIGATALAEAYAINYGKYDAIKLYFDGVEKALSNNGIVQGTQPGVLQFNGDTAIADINFKDKSMRFGDVKASATKDYGGRMSAIDTFPQYSGVGPDSDFDATPVDVYYQLRDHKMDQSFDPNQATTLVLPSGMSRFVKLWNVQAILGRRGAWAESAARDIFLKDPRFKILWYAFGGDFGFASIDYGYKYTPVNVTLDNASRSIVMPVMATDTDAARAADVNVRTYLQYILNGGGGHYQLMLGEAPFNYAVKINQSDDKGEAWFIDPTRRLATSWSNAPTFAEKVSGPVQDVLSSLQIGDASLVVKTQNIVFNGKPHNVTVGLPDATGSGTHLMALIDFDSKKMSISAYFDKPFYSGSPLRSMQYVAKVLQSSGVANDPRVTNPTTIGFAFTDNFSGFYNAKSDVITFLKRDANGKISGIWVTNENALYTESLSPQGDELKTFDAVVANRFMPVHDGEMFNKDGRLFLKSNFDNGIAGHYVAEVTAGGLTCNYIELESFKAFSTQYMKSDEIGISDALLAQVSQGSKGVPIASDATLAVVDGNNALYFQNANGKYGLVQGSITDGAARYSYSNLGSDRFILVMDNSSDEANELSINARWLKAGNWNVADTELMVATERASINIPVDALQFKGLFIDIASSGSGQKVNFQFDQRDLKNLRVVQNNGDLVMTFDTPGAQGHVSHIRFGNVLSAGVQPTQIQFGHDQALTPASLLNQFNGNTKSLSDLNTLQLLASNQSPNTQVAVDKLIQSMASLHSKDVATDVLHHPLTSQSVLMNLVPSRV